MESGITWYDVPGRAAAKATAWGTWQLSTGRL
jgi:hypothetical protein